MDANLLWQLLEDICQLGEFIAAIETKGVEINAGGLMDYDWFVIVQDQRSNVR